jgi:hypothetical protein
MVTFFTLAYLIAWPIAFIFGVDDEGIRATYSAVAATILIYLPKFAFTLSGLVMFWHTKRLNEILNTDAGARYVGEFSLGFNPYILNPMCDILFDEKIAGSLHFTPGQAYEDCGNGNKSAIHWDMVCDLRKGGEVRVDGTVFLKDGKILI